MVVMGAAKSLSIYIYSIYVLFTSRFVSLRYGELSPHQWRSALIIYPIQTEGV